MKRARTENRRFPRVTINGAGALSVGTRALKTESDLPTSDGHQTAKIRIANLSPEGAGIIASAKLEIDRHDQVMFHMSLKGTQLNLPATLVWKSDEGDGTLKLGLHLQLELAAAGHRRQYAEWIVGKIRDQIMR